MKRGKNIMNIIKKFKMRISGKEKSKDEVVFNNLISYMDEKSIPKDEQCDIVKKYSLKKLATKRNIIKNLTLAGLGSVLMLAGYVGKVIFNLPFFLTNVAVMSGAIITIVNFCLERKNPYDNCHIRPDVNNQIRSFENTVNSRKFKKKCLAYNY